MINDQRKKTPPKVDFCLAIVTHLRSTRQSYKWSLPHSSPINLVTYFGDFASLVEGLIETSDRDFVRNVLKNGQLNDLSANIQELIKLNNLSHAEMASYILRMKKFTDSLIPTLQAFVKVEPSKASSWGAQYFEWLKINIEF